MITALLLLLGVASVGVIIMMIRDRKVARGPKAARARMIAVAASVVLLLLVIVAFTGVLVGDVAQIVVIVVGLLLLAAALSAAWFTFRKPPRQQLPTV